LDGEIGDCGLGIADLGDRAGTIYNRAKSKIQIENHQSKIVNLHRRSQSATINLIHQSTIKPIPIRQSPIRNAF
jgi:hypothetical protein